MKALNPVVAIVILLLGIPAGMAGFAMFVTPVEQPAPAVVVDMPAVILEPMEFTVLIPPVPTLEEVVAATVTIKCVGEGNREWSGSGAFIDDCGTILTAAHVLKGAVVIMVILGDGTIHPAVDPYFLPEVDAGFCKFIGPQPNAYLKIADEKVHVGDTVRVIGSPLGLTLSGSVSQGIVSCVMRMHDDTEYIQVDASAVPGNSGGPVVNLNGDIIGVLVAGVAVGVEINFVVPADQVAALWNCYEAHKTLKAVLWHPQPQPQN
jgi:S1-C subfamily serine protease